MKLPLIIIAVCAGLVVAGSVQSSEIKINQKYTAVQHPTMVDTNADGVFADVADFQLVGSPGRATMQGVIRSSVDFGDTPCDLQFTPVQQSYIQTYNDGSMLFLMTTAGSGCLNFVTSELWGELSGIITGGIGRFESATGNWTAEINGIVVGPGHVAYWGKMKGTVEIPD